MARIPLLFLFIFWGVTGLYSQPLTGKVVDTLQQPVAGITITISEGSKPAILTYGFSKENGSFRLLLPTETVIDTLLVRFSGIGYKDRTISIHRPFQPLEVIMHRTVFELPKVVVRNTPPPIRKKGDTLIYKVDAFADAKDRSIADVLAKMPGIEIRSDGAVLYQGRPIQKYYIEGLDLLEDKYALANNNLPHRDVSAVEVLENHQPIRILDSLVPSNRASLNIRLKKAVTHTGTAIAGVGFKPLLWEGNITPMVFNKKRQLLASFQANNTGNDVSRDLKSLSFDQLIERLEENNARTDLLTTIGPAAPAISPRRFLYNNIQMPTINLLNRLNKDWELRINASYVRDRQQQEGENRTTFITPAGNLLLIENAQSHVQVNDFQGSATMHRNAAKNYLKNVLTMQAAEDSRQAVIDNTQSRLSQSLNNPYYHVDNRLKWIFTAGKQLLTFNSYINHSRSPHRLQVQPGLFSEALNNGVAYSVAQQNAARNFFQANHSIETTKGKGALTLQGKAGYDFRILKTTTGLFIDEQKKGQKFTNNLHNTTSRAYLQPGIGWRKNRWDLSLQLPVSLWHVNLTDYAIDTATSKTAVVVQPTISYRFEANAYWTLFSTAHFSNELQRADRVLFGSVLYNYRNLVQPNFPLAQVASYFLSTGVQYKKPASGLFFHGAYNYTHTAQPFISQSVLGGDGSQIQAIQAFNNIFTGHDVSVKGSKFFSALATTLNLGASLSMTTGYQFINGQILQIRNKTLQPNLKVNTQFSKIIGWEYAAIPNFSTNRSGVAATKHIFILSQSGKLNLYPAKNNYLALSAESFYNDLGIQQAHNVYIDFLYRYTISKNRVDLEIKCLNLLNQKTFVSSTFTDFYFLVNTFSIRPRQALVSVRIPL